ncbi:MAG: glycosyltransferase family 2 protein [Candidatus Methylumidiphilus sp.]
MDATRMQVSVVMPSLNQAEFIEDSVNSVLGQDFPHIDLVVADGGSGDGTLQRLEALLSAYGPRLRWLSEPDAGPAAAVNKALGRARGGIIGWLNSDDLYAPGAVAAAVRHFAEHPEAVMVYGEGEHIDAAGRSLGRYPTRPPEAGIDAFHDGCFICQPTVFLRRAALDALGPLDETLATAFDFDLWLRLFRRFPGQIARLDRVQAYSRLHGGCITQRLRRRVALEGMQVLARHLGHALPHWLLTYFEELYASHPFGDDIPDLRAHAAEALGQARCCLDGNGLRQMESALAGDARLRLALPGIFASVHADGWAPPLLALRCRGASIGRTLRLRCVHARPQFVPLPVTIKTSWGGMTQVMVERPGPFTLVVDFADSVAGGNRVILIESANSFVPQAADPRSADTRRLAFKVEGLQLSN